MLLDGADAESGSRVAIIDAMGVVQSIKKTAQMKKMKTRVVFDEYLDNSFKENTRVKTASDGKEKKKMVPNINYRINENMTLASVSLKSLLTSTKTKRNLTKFLADGLLQRFYSPLMVVQGVTTRGVHCGVSDDMRSHTHE